MMQIIEQTDEEKMAMYMKMPKKKIIEMLIQSNKFINSLTPQASFISSKQDVIKLVCDHNKMSRQKEIICTCDKCGHKWFTE